MKTLLTKIGLSTVLAATALTAVTPAMAQPYRHRDNTGIAIGAGILGLAVGAAIADRGDRYYYDRDYYARRHYVRVEGRPGYYYYYDGAPRRYYQDRYYDRYYAPYYRDHYYSGRWYGEPRGWQRGPGWDRGRGPGWDRGHDRRDWDRGHDRGAWNHGHDDHDRGHWRR
ncbi:hypothetical protein [Novosphingobium sp. 9]|uniref:hypothetical protein n=1 Tax=Novosphingobium sp. 9 TaxID=2025349 RepID=UPI0021B5C46E|nr:hypothetical protein [Novosphingobium sp. 9]